MPDHTQSLPPEPPAADPARAGGEPAAAGTGPDSTRPGWGPAGPRAAPTRAGRFDLLGEIARGGMGVVYRAADPVLGRGVAVKVLAGRYEAGSAAARLQHPGIPPVHDLGELPDGRPFLALKLIDGRTLDALLAGGGCPPNLVAVFESICQAVAYAHSKGVIHRDLKPANVMVGSFGEVQVMDWGLAKVVGSRQRAVKTPRPGRT